VRRFAQDDDSGVEYRIRFAKTIRHPARDKSVWTRRLRFLARRERCRRGCAFWRKAVTVEIMSTPPSDRYFSYCYFEFLVGRPGLVARG
jgi:hypothetical protein